MGHILHVHHQKGSMQQHVIERDCLPKTALLHAVLISCSHMSLVDGKDQPLMHLSFTMLARPIFPFQMGNTILLMPVFPSVLSSWFLIKVSTIILPNGVEQESSKYYLIASQHIIWLNLLSADQPTQRNYSIFVTHQRIM